MAFDSNRSDLVSAPVRAKRILFGHHATHRKMILSGLDHTRFEPHFIEDLTGIGSLEMYDLICPLTLQDYTVLRQAIAAGAQTNVLMPDAETVDRLHNKSACSAWMRALGFHHLMADAADLPAFPCVAKPARGVFGKRIKVVRNAMEMVEFLEQCGPDISVQPLVPGCFEYATHIIATEGVVRRMFTVRYRMRSGDRIKGVGNAPCGQLWVDTPFAREFSELIEALNYTGSCCIDYKVHEGRPYIFEINPRVGASLLARPNMYLDACLSLDDSAHRACQAVAAPVPHQCSVI